MIAAERVRHELLAAAKISAAILCIATCWAWVRSYRGQEAVEFEARQVRWQATVLSGRLVVTNQPQLDYEDQERRALYHEGVSKFVLLMRHVLECQQAWADLYVAEKPVPQALVDDLRRTEELAHEQSKRNHAVISSTAKTALETFQVPIAALVVGLAALPFVALLTYLRRRIAARRRRQRGLCLICGYDLKGTSGSCPECGARATLVCQE